MKTIRRIDSSDKSWEIFTVRNPKLKKQVGLYETEAIENTNMITIAVNPKEYFEKYKDKNINKKDKGMRKDAPGMTFESFTQRIMSLRDYDANAKKNKKKKIWHKKDFK